MFRKPLYQITCGDLGTTASEVETALETHFALANRWGCVLLLDEADVFLAARSKQDFIRNGMVSVFLRVLEYYAGILFLTTNRVGDFDEAFTSRIHISLYYPQLDDKSTQAIFELNLDLIEARFQEKNRAIEIQRQQILELAKGWFMDDAQHTNADNFDRGEQHPQSNTIRWNGRQIRNACQTALALAEFRAQGGNYKQVRNADAMVVLTVDDLKTVAEAYLQFMHYLSEVHGMDAERMAQSYMLRATELNFFRQLGMPVENNPKPTAAAIPRESSKRQYNTYRSPVVAASGSGARPNYMASMYSQPHMHPPPPPPPLQHPRVVTPNPAPTYPPPPQHQYSHPNMMPPMNVPQYTMPGHFPGGNYSYGADGSGGGGYSIPNGGDPGYAPVDNFTQQEQQQQEVPKQEWQDPTHVVAQNQQGQTRGGGGLFSRYLWGS